MILEKRNEGGGLVAPPPVSWLLKKATRTFNFLQMILLVKDIRKFRISLRNELLYSYVFITYMREFIPSTVYRSLQ